MLSAIPFLFTPIVRRTKEAWKNIRRHEWDNSTKGDLQAGIKILQPAIFHISVSSDVVLWCPFMGVKLWDINMLLAEMEIWALGNY